MESGKIIPCHCCALAGVCIPSSASRRVTTRFPPHSKLWGTQRDFSRIAPGAILSSGGADGESLVDHLASTTTAETLHQLLVSDDMGDTIRMPTDCSTSRSRDVHCIEKLDSSAVHSAMDALDGTSRITRMPTERLWESRRESASCATKQRRAFSTAPSFPTWIALVFCYQTARSHCLPLS